MDDPITCSLGTMGPLLAQLHSLTDTERSLPEGISKDELQGLIQDLKEIYTSIMDLAKEEDPLSTDKFWMKEVREICYDAEDYLATVMHAGASNQIAQNISEFRARLEDANKRRKKRKLDDLRARLKQDARERRERYQPALDGFKTIVESVLQAPNARPDEPMNELVRLLAFDRDQQLKVMPIFGFPGVGKTTLARRLYHQYGGRFQCRAFLRVSRNPDPRRLLTSMLSQIKGSRPHGSRDVQDLTDSINKHLQGKTYFIIVDDLWDASVWDIISHAFPAGNCCSRIITTTQIEVVALACCSYCSENIYKMRPPSNDLSRQLFFGNFQVMKEVVKLIYNDLPPHLKTCLLYLSIYPEGYKIRKDDLVKQWVAEGFLGAVDGKDIEEVAGGYFGELVTRGMIQPADTNDNDEVVSCTVHHMVLDFITYKSMEENFVTIVDYFAAVTGLPDKVRRLSMKFGSAKSAQIQGSFRMSQVRSLIFFGFLKCVPSIVGYKLLRVLILHIWTDQDTTSFDLGEICELFQLRYLKIECNMTVKLPTNILGLKYLETLEINARVTAVPSDIVDLQCLLHLRLPSEADLPNRIGCMTSLRSLGYFNLSTSSGENVLDLGKLTKLRDLYITCCTDPANRLVTNMELLASILGECSSLKSLVLDGGASSSMCISCDDGLGSMSTPPASLERLTLSRICMFSSLPRWIGKLDKLCILKIAIGEMSRDGINVLKELNALAALSLYVQTAPSERIVFHKEGFKSLKHFKFICSALCLAFEKGAVPNVRRFKLGFNAQTIEQYSPADAGFENLTGLEVFTAKIGCAGATESGRKVVQSALEDAFRNCESHPVINALWVDWIFYGDKEMSTVAQTDSSLNNARLKKLDEIVEIEWEKVFRVKDEILKKLDELFVEIQIRGEYEKTRTQEEKYKTREKQDEILEGDSDEQHGTKQKGSGKDTSKKPDSRTSTASEPSSYVQSQGDKEMSTVTQTEQPQTLGKADVITKGSSDEQHRTGEKSSTEDTDIQADSSLYNALIKKLDKLDSRARDKDEIVYIEWDKEALTRMIEELDSRAGELMEKWILQLQDLVYDIEDFIDVYNVAKSWAHADFDMIQHLKGRTEILRREWQQWPSGGIAAASGTSAGSTLPVYAPEHELVGIDEPKRELMQFLELEAYDEQSEKLRVISIVGCRGVGKTALARAVYEDPSVQREFEFFAWVVASECRDGKDLLDKIEQQVSQKLSVLCERFLVVIDELQRASVWYDIQRYFRRNRRGSRIIITTSIESVAAACTSGSGSYIYRMRGLGRSESEQLFLRKVGRSEPEQVFWSKVGRGNILYKKCGGLPLALISVANYLREKGQNLHQLELGPGAFEGVNRVLMQIYDSLPDSGHRKCLLSLSTIPKGYPIQRKSLIRRWIAEGLAVGDGTLSAEQVAGNRFDEFIDRNIIEPVLVGNNSKVKRCRVSPVILEFIVDKAVSKDMVALIRMNEPLANKKGAHPVRQLSIQRATKGTGRVAAEIGLNHHVRSLTVRDRWSFYLPFDIRSCRLLRVLDMEGCRWIRDSTLSDICRLLVLLKYLSLRGTYVRRIADGIRNLYDLETLDIRETQVEVPMEVMMLPRLAHLFGKFQLPPELENAERRDKLQRFFSEESRLQTLSGFVIGKNSGFELILLHMRLLRKVKIWRTDDISIRTRRLLASSLEKRITGNSALESLSIDFGTENMNFLDDIQLEAPCMLSSIKLRGRLRRGRLMRLPSFIASHRSNLSELQLSYTGLSLEDLSVLQHLRRLLYLKLVEGSDFGNSMGDKLIVESGGFPSLRRLCFQAFELPRVHIVKGGMRSLTSLHLFYYMESQTWKPSDFNWEIENLENLQEVVLRYTVSDEELDAWKSRARSHINRPKVTQQPIEYLW
ncbi:disease resistance protein RGA5-like isoform X2 [Phragmites australis]|uniref:disease resistance protein RGA5-like isoform X2 n=1 Tax=Phragmites australis TaxID=29695 RepID=UPI002D77FC00|nr:disease resistance protein RGA5-like isoform X2 [Phragmites australis]